MLEVVLLIVGIVGGVLAIGGPIGGAALWESRLRTRFVHRQFFDLLNFDRRREVLFVFPAIEPVPGRRFRQIAWGDARAIEYVLRALALCNWPMDRVGMRGVWRSPVGAIDGYFDQQRDWRENLVIIGSPKTNPICELALDRVQSTNCRFGFRSAELEEDWQIFLAEFCDKSPSFGDEGQGKHELADYGLLAKATNPWNHDAKILFVAGIRAFGTWGAAKGLLERAPHLHSGVRDLPGFGKEDFATVLTAHYMVNEWRIDRIERTRIFCRLW